MEYLYSIFIIIFDLLSLINISSASAKRKSNSNYVFAIYVVIFFLLTNFIIREATWYKAIVVILITSLSIYFSYSQKIGTIFFNTVIWYVFIILSEYIVLLPMEIISGFSLNAILSDAFAVTILAIISRFFLFVLTYFYKKIKTDDDFVSGKNWIKFLLYPLISIFTCFLLVDVQLKNNSTSWLLLIDVFGIILSNIIILTVMSQLENENKIKNDNIILAHRIKTEMMNVKSLSDAYSEQRKLTHDFENHLRVINGLAAHNDSSNIVDYTSRILKGPMSNIMVVNSNNIIVDTILNQKYSQARKAGVAVEFKLNDLSQIKVEPEDMVTIISNAMDNAIAAAQISEKKFIKVIILHENDELLISFANSVYEDVKVSDNNVISRKKGIEHGYGIHNIKTALEKYENILSIACDDLVFKLAIIIY